MRKFALASLVVGGFITAAAGNSLAQDAPGKTDPGGWAVVASDGKLQGHENVMQVSHSNPGVYDVKFNQKVSDCAATATIGGSTKSLIPGYIALTKNSDVIGVHTFDATTALPADFKFNLNVACAKS
jgi:hypothetical protein